MEISNQSLFQVQDAATAVYNKIVPSAEAKESSEARQHLNKAGDAAQDAGRDIKTSAYELKEAVADGARDYGRAARDRCTCCMTCFLPFICGYAPRFSLFCLVNPFLRVSIVLSCS